MIGTQAKADLPGGEGRLTYSGIYLNATMVFARVIVVISSAFRKAGIQRLPIFLYRAREMTAAMARVGTMATSSMPERAAVANMAVLRMTALRRHGPILFPIETINAVYYRSRKNARGFVGIPANFRRRLESGLRKC